MPADLLKLQYGPQSNSLPSKSTASNGTMYVHTSTTPNGTKNGVNIYDATLYFDLGDTRYQIQGNAFTQTPGKLYLKLGDTTLTESFNGASDVTWTIPLATASTVGLVSTAAQTFAGKKTFSGGIAVTATSTMRSIISETNDTYDLGSSTNVWKNVYATTFHGALDGKAATAGKADSTVGSLTLKLNDTQLGSAFNGASGVSWNIPLAGASTTGLVGTGAQTFAGAKTFSGAFTVSNTASLQNTNPAADNTYSLGTSALRWKTAYATTFYGALEGNAKTATSAKKVDGALKINNGAAVTQTYNGSSDVQISLADLVNDKIPLDYIPQAAIERVHIYATADAAQTAADNGEVQEGDLIRIGENGNIMYYVRYKPNSSGGTVVTLEQFAVGIAAEAIKVSKKLTLTINSAAKKEYDGSSAVTFDIPAANGTTTGVVTTGDQSFAGTKTFTGAISVTGATTLNSTLAVKNTATMRHILPEANNTYELGSSSMKWKTIYATTFNGNATSASVATKVKNPLTYQLEGENPTQETLDSRNFDGTSKVTWTIPLATGSAIGLVSTTTQTFAGNKTFSGTVTINNTVNTQTIIPTADNTYNLGSTGTGGKKWANIYATTFHGALDGNATTASSANKVAQKLTLSSTGGTGISKNEYDGSTAVTISTFKAATASAAGGAGFVPGPAANDHLKILRGDGTWRLISGSGGITVTNPTDSTGNITIAHSHGAATTSSVSTSIVSGTAFTANKISTDSQGHVDSITTYTYTATVTPESDYSQGDKIAKVLGVDIYAGIKWGTF